MFAQPPAALMTRLQKIKRPKTLIAAARDHQRRSRGLGVSTLGLLDLLDKEEALNQQRKSQDADYNVQRHIKTLSALMTEARTWQAPSDVSVPG